ncbi:plasmolipin [Archocentrus centrarchus]|uniref:plasmolipin n=1 Tax=Archocentrus centrarchus TaxID=63155 RepID=UPI0011EA17ED|nr:plasmolipin [Archocentrus centrarchus]
MADFPSKVTTETSVPHSQGNSFQGMAASVTFRVDMSFIRSIPAILMMVESILGLLHWTLIASTLATVVPAYGWVLFVAITLWILTTILFFVILFSVTQQLPTVPWPLTVMVYNGAATVLYITAFLTNATHVAQYQLFSFYEHLAAAAFFGAVVTVAYGASAFLSYLDWKGDGGNAATNTVPT